MFRRLLEVRMGKRGKREFVQVLRLLETFRGDDVVAGIKEAIASGAEDLTEVTLDGTFDLTMVADEVMQAVAKEDAARRKA